MPRKALYKMRQDEGLCVECGTQACASASTRCKKCHAVNKKWHWLKQCRPDVLAQRRSTQKESHMLREKRLCVEDGCTRTSAVKLQCAFHYHKAYMAARRLLPDMRVQQLEKQKKQKEKQTLRENAVCCESDCARKRYAKMRCVLHYRRYYRKRTQTEGIDV